MGRLYLRILLTVATLLLSANAAHAETFAPAQITPEQLLQKADAVQGELQRGRYVILEQSKSAGTSTTIVTRIDGDDRRTTERTGDFHVAYGRYNGQAWEQDENGMVRYETRRSKIAAALDTPGKPDGVVRVLGLTAGPVREYVLDVHPLASDEQLRYYDAKTFLLDRTVTKYVNGVEATVKYSDYRNVFGAMQAFHWEYNDGRAENDETGNIVTFERSGDTTPLTPPDSYALYTVPKGQTITLPAKLTRGFITVTVNVGGEALDFALDTGDSSLSIDPGALHRLGIASYGRSKERIGGDFDSSRATVPELSIGPLHLHNVAMDVVPFDSESHVGLLGCDFLASAIIGIDMKHQKVTVTAPGAFDPKPLGLVALPAQLDDCVPEVRATFDGNAGTFVFDTGSAVSVLEKPFAEKIGSKKQVNPDAVESLGFIGGDVDASYYEVPNLIFGPIEFRKSYVMVPANRTADFGTDDGIIGRDVLQAYVIYLDYSSGTVYLKPND